MNSAPPKLSNPRQASQRLALGIGGVMALGVGVTLYFFNPSQYHIYPVCQFHQLTGLYCPGCGATRGLYALLHGDVIRALHDNALLFLLLPAAVGRGLWLALEKYRGRPARNFFPPQSLWVLLTLALVFWVLRNLPGFAFLAPI